MNYQQVFSDSNLKQEFLDRFGELSAAGEFRGLESLEGGVSLDDATNAVERMAEGTWTSQHAGLEAIIERFTRPVLFVQQSTFHVPQDGFPDSEEIVARLETARVALERVIPSAGRIDLRNHRLDWVGTGWMVGTDVVVTNRHVAEEFARADGNGFAFRQNANQTVRATLDWRHEYLQDGESRFAVKEVLWIEPDGSVDVALLRIARAGENDEPAPPIINLMTQQELDDAEIGTWMAVIGYPAQDSRNNAQDQQRIFDGVYNVKRLAPGQITAKTADGLLNHDATTLGGNSGSAVIDLASGKAAGLHFGGVEGDTNSAVQASRVAEILADHAA